MNHFRSPVRRLRCLILLLCVSVLAIPCRLSAEEPDPEMEGLASWYGGQFQGRPTASGELFDTNQLTAAHRTLPFGTIVRVTRIDNGLEVEVRINDRGPFVEGRVIDLSFAAASALEMTGDGVAPVRLTVVGGVDEPVRSIQVISVSSPERAAQLARTLRDEGIGARVEQARGGVYRVVVPNVADSAVAGVVARLDQLGFHSVFVRSR